jgi:DNA-binding transcriptional LysR family regulator
MTQSSVSKSIFELEKELGVKLFERTKKGCTLTVAGEAFLPEAYHLVSVAENIKAKVSRLPSGESGMLSIGYATELMVDPLAECFRGFVKKYPAVNLSFLHHSSISVSRRIANNEIDLAFGRYDALIKRDGLEWRHVFNDPIYVFLPLGHPLAGESAITVEMLADETINIVSREINPGYFDVIQMLFYRKGIAPFMNTDFNERKSILFMVRIGRGITLLTKQWLKTHCVDDIVTLPLEEEYAYFDNGVAWRKDNANPAVSLFLDELFAYMGTSSDAR